MGTAWHRTVAAVSILLFFSLFLSACGAQVHLSSNPFPTISIAPTFTFTPTDTPPPLPLIPTATLACTDGLTFVDDITIPDHTVVSPGSLLDKQWRVRNSGTCNWDNRYRLRLISGDALGVAAEQALFPARAGSEAVIQVEFKAPADPGDYTSEWQAFDPNGIPFGDSFYIQVTVSG